MTQTSVLIPILLALMLTRWNWILVMLPTCAILQSAAVLQIGSFGLNPGYFLGLLILGRTIVEVAFQTRTLNRYVLSSMIPLFFFFLAALISLWIALVFFQGRINVIGGTDAFVIERASPYQFRRENITQMAYLLMDIGIVYAIAHQVARFEWDQVEELLDHAFVLCLLMAGGLCLWQYVSSFTGIPWPDNFFHSNSSYAAAGNQRLFGELKVNGPFAEPSAVAYYFAGLLFFAWFRFCERFTTLSACLVALAVVVLFLSKSTSAFLVIGVFGLLVGKAALGLLVRSKIPRLRLRWGGIAAVLALLACVVAGCIFLINNQNFISELFTKMVLEKSESSSYEQRSAVNEMALEILIQTKGVGIGLGSHKPSSLVMTLLSNVGIVGTLVLCAFFAYLAFPRSRVPDERDSKALKLITPHRWFLLGLLMIHSFSAPNLSAAILFVSCGFLCGAIAVNRAMRERSALRRTQMNWAPEIHDAAASYT